MFFISLTNVTADKISYTSVDTKNQSWEQLPQGIAVAFALTNSLENDSKKGILHVYIKNTSDVPKKYIVSGAMQGINLFYVDSHASQIPLRNDNSNVELRMFSETIMPHSILSIKIDLKSDELVAVKTHPIICSFVIYDPASKQKYTIQSSLKSLATVSEAEK